MGDLIHDRRQKPLPWQSHKTVCLRRKGSKTVYYASMRSGVEVIGGRRFPCPECGGKGAVLDLDLPSLSCIDAVGTTAGRDRRHAAKRRTGG